jgi:hypothetical protein
MEINNVIQLTPSRLYTTLKTIQKMKSAIVDRQWQLFAMSDKRVRCSKQTRWNIIRYSLVFSVAARYVTNIDKIFQAVYSHHILYIS